MKIKTLFLSAALLALRAFAADYNLTVNYASDVGAIAPELIGTNAIYSNEPDAQWQNGTGNIPTLLANISTKLVRFPAGTVVTFWHWNDPNVPGHTDSWDPNYNHANDKPASATMNIDEYLAYCGAKGTTPLVGINMGSGKRWNRVQDGINEAKALVQHCMASGVNVVYYYLDNEPYAADANYTWTAAEYAASINQYVPALKSVNPNIKIIANLHPGANTTGYNYTTTVVQQAGANIDFADIHMYWRYNAATFANWTSEPQMMHQQTRPFSEMRTFYRQMFADAGFPNIELAALEWNVGPNGTGNPEPTEAETALMCSEQLMQYIQSGLKLAAFWPLHWESGDWHRAQISSAQSYTPNKVYDMFQQFATIGWRMQVSNTLTGSQTLERLRHVSVKTNDGQTVYVYLVNKNQAKTSSTVDIDMSSFTGFNAQSAVAFESTDTSVGPLNVHSLTVTKSGTHLTITMPKNSFAKVTVTRPAQNVTMPAFAAAKDAMVKFAAPTTNFGTATNMQVSGQTNFQKQMFLQFNVTGIPAGATVVSATLRIDAQTTGTGRSITAHSVTSTSWTETGITWNTKPALGTARGTVSSHTANAYSEWDVTAGVTGNANYAFGLDSTFSGDTNFFSKESGSGTAPQLVIVYQP
jgi:alpha-L-arabinofuranosidase